MLKTIDAVPTRDELIYARLRPAIVEGTLEPGQDVVVTTVAAQLGVSRIPVMHACQRLVGEGFLVSNPRCIVTVAPITEQRIAEGNEVLLALECVALEHAGQRATAADLDGWDGWDDWDGWDELNRAVRAFRRSPGSYEMNVADCRFHTTLWAAAGKPYLYQHLSLDFDHTESARVLARLLHDPEASSNEHQEILDALRRHDVAAAQAALRGGHRSHGTRRAIEALRQKRNPSRARPQHSTLGE